MIEPMFILFTPLTPAEATLGVACIGALVSMFTLVYSRRSANEAREANQAVNHNKDKGMPRIYDLVADNHRSVANLEAELVKVAERQLVFERRWDNTPWRSGKHIAAWVEEQESKVLKLRTDLNNMIKQCPACELGKFDEISRRLSTIEKRLKCREEDKK